MKRCVMLIAQDLKSKINKLIKIYDGWKLKICQFWLTLKDYPRIRAI